MARITVHSMLRSFPSIRFIIHGSQFYASTFGWCPTDNVFLLWTFFSLFCVVQYIRCPFQHSVVRRSYGGINGPQPGIYTYLPAYLPTSATRRRNTQSTIKQQRLVSHCESTTPRTSESECGSLGRIFTGQPAAQGQDGIASRPVCSSVRKLNNRKSGSCKENVYGDSDG
jgi:hypothetical protein